MDFTYVGYFSSTWRKGHFTHVETSSWGQNVSCLHHSIIYEVLFRSVHNLELLQMKTNWTHLFQTLNTQMKKALLIKTNTLRVQSQTGKMKRFLQEVLRADVLTQVCKQVKEQARKESWELPGKAGAQGYTMVTGDQGFWAPQAWEAGPGALLKDQREKQQTESHTESEHTPTHTWQFWGSAPVQAPLTLDRRVKPNSRRTETNEGFRS